MAVVTYVPIFCETKRLSDMEHREGMPWIDQGPPGRCYAERQNGHWLCCCCGKAVSVVW